MTGSVSSVALCAALPLPEGEGASAPDFIHLLPAGEVVTVDGRGPYRIPDAQALVAVSLQSGARLPIDENHATDLAAPKGAPAPARGWIVALSSREDGIWGQVEWTSAGRQLVADRAYRHISPVISHHADGSITGVLRASLVNRPNLRGLVALHSEGEFPPFLEKLRTALQLGPEASLEDVLERIRSDGAEREKRVLDQQAVLARLRTILSLKDDATAEHIITRLESDVRERGALAETVGLQAAAAGGAVLQAVQELTDPAKRAATSVVVALQAQLSDLTERVAREKATGFVDAAIRAGKIAAPPLVRDHYIARHMADPGSVEREIGAMVSLTRRGVATGSAPTFGSGGKPELTHDEAHIVALMGVDPERYRQIRDEHAARQEEVTL